MYYVLYVSVVSTLFSGLHPFLFPSFLFLYTHDCSCLLTIGLFNEYGVRVDSSNTADVLLAHSENVLQAFQCDGDYSGVLNCQQVTQWLDATDTHQVSVRERGQAMKKGERFGERERTGQEGTKLEGKRTEILLYMSICIFVLSLNS